MAYSSWQMARKYARYYLTASNGKGHGIHSPFVYDFVRKVLNGEGDEDVYAAVEAMRRRLKRDKRWLDVEDLGAGSAVPSGKPYRRKVGDVVRRAAKPRRLGQLLYRLARHYRPSTMIELGTSLGLSTAYLALGGQQARIYTIEGSGAIAAVAEENFSQLGIDNAEQKIGDFDGVLGTLLENVGDIDLAFVDGNHRLEPTLRYFNQLWAHSSSNSVLIFDDIHWSEEMEKAWSLIRKDPRVYMTVDLFFLGMVFRRDEFRIKQEFTIRY